MTGAEPLSTRRQFAGFLAAGVISSVFNLGSRALFSLAMPFEVAVLLAYAVGFTIAFLINKRYAFPASGGDARAQYVKFALVNLFSLLQVWLVSVGLLRLVLPAIGWTWQAEFIAHFLGIASPVATNFFIYKYFVFRDAPARVPAPQSERPE